MKLRHAPVTLTALAVALGGAVLIVPSAPPAPTNIAVPELAAAALPELAIAGGGSVAQGAQVVPGPTAPNPTENAPSDPFANAPTVNLNRVANALRMRNKSVTTVVTLPAGLALGTTMEVSVLFGNQRITQSYNNAAGNRIITNFPALDGQRRQERVTISLAEKTTNGYATYSVPWSVDLEPLYDISTGPLSFVLHNICDTVGSSEPIIKWALPDGELGEADLTMDAGDSVTLRAFARTYTEAGISRDLREPGIRWREDDPNWFWAGFYANASPGGPLLPGATRTVAWTIDADNDADCSGSFRYDLTYRLRWYPDL